MKTTKLITAALFATLAFAACNKEEDAPAVGLQPGQVDIRTTICATTGKQTDTRATIAPDGSGTFATGDELGLYATVANDAKQANASYKIGETTLYWDQLSTTQPVTFSAYYPKVADITDATAYAFSAATAAMPDLLVATPVTKSKGEPVTLDFRHAMHRLVVDVTTNVPDWDASTARITLTGMNAAATVNILTGTVTPGEASDADGDYAAQTGATTTFIVAPQKVTAGADWIQIEIGGKTFTYPVPAQYTKPEGGTETLTQLNSGETLTLNLSVNREGVTLTSGDIAKWDTQGTIDDTIDVGGNTPAGITTQQALQDAITAATGTADNPTVITLGADFRINTTDGNDPVLIDSKHIKIDGGGHTLTSGNETSIFEFFVLSDGTLSLSNITLDGEGKKLAQSFIVTSGTLTLGSGTILKNAKTDGFNTGAVSATPPANTLSTVIVEAGAELTGIEDAAIQSSGSVVRLNGGSFSNNRADIALMCTNANTKIEVAAWPQITGGDNKLKLCVNYDTRDRNTLVATGIAPYKIENADGFSLTEARDYNSDNVVPSHLVYNSSGNGTITIEKDTD